jgi:hypothetical protein
MDESRIEPPLNNEGTPRYYNDEWNQVDKSPSQEKQYKNQIPSGDEDHEDFVDTHYSPSEYKKNTWEYTDDEYEEYGN